MEHAGDNYTNCNWRVKPVKHLFKIDLVSNPARAEGLVNMVIGAFGTVTKGLLKGLEDLEVGGRVETIQTTALCETARIQRRVLET